jgi:hypothetical protein
MRLASGPARKQRLPYQERLSSTTEHLCKFNSTQKKGARAYFEQVIEVLGNGEAPWHGVAVLFDQRLSNFTRGVSDGDCLHTEQLWKKGESLHGA